MKLSESFTVTARVAAHNVLRELKPRWSFQPEDFNAVQEAMAANAAMRLRESGLLPHEERNDAFIVAEAAVLHCILLVSRDSHLLDLDHGKLTFIFQQLDLPAPIISSPEKLFKRFYV